MGMTARDLDALQHTVSAVGRTGAAGLEIGYLDDDPPHRWYATAQYEGAKVSCDNQHDPLAAVLGLYAMLAAGGQCTTCHRTVVLEHGHGLVAGARMEQGVFETRMATRARRNYCVRRLRRDGWPPCRQAKAGRP